MRLSKYGTLRAMKPRKKTDHAQEDFTDVFRDRLEKIEKDAVAVGLDFTKICRETGVSRSTPDRWKRKVPKTISLVTKMERLVEKEKTAQQR